MREMHILCAARIVTRGQQRRGKVGYNEEACCMVTARRTVEKEKSAMHRHQEFYHGLRNHRPPHRGPWGWGQGRQKGRRWAGRACGCRPASSHTRRTAHVLLEAPFKGGGGEVGVLKHRTRGFIQAAKPECLQCRVPEEERQALHARLSSRHIRRERGSRSAGPEVCCRGRQVVEKREGAQWGRRAGAW